MNLNLHCLNTFNKGKWIVFPNISNKLDNEKEKICLIVTKLFENTQICLKNYNNAMKLLENSTLFVFVDNKNNPQIVGNVSYNCLENFRGTIDGDEQNISSEYLPVANEFLQNNMHLICTSSWAHQINWLNRLENYVKQFNEKRYDKINVSSLIEDLSYNGFSLRYKDCDVKEKLFYPRIKRELIKHPMLKPMLAKYLNCKTDEVFIGKYQGNGKTIKYIIGDCISNYIVKDSALIKVYGSINIKSYFGEFNVFNLPATLGVSVDYQNEINFEIDSLFKGNTINCEEDIKNNTN